MDKQHHDHHEGSGFFNGFLLGAIIGAAVIFFLFTDKGKKLLKTFMEEGLEGFDEFKYLLQEEMDEDEETEEYEDMADTEGHLTPVPHHAEHSHVEPIHADHSHEDRHHEDHDHHDHESHHEQPAPAPSKVKRFFRGVKR